MSAAFLIVEDDELCSRGLARLLQSLATITVADTLALGRALVRSGPPEAAGPWTGAIVDLVLPDGLGLELALELRTQTPPVPTLVLTGLVDRVAINDAQVAGAEFALKPPDRASLFAFAARALRGPGAHGPDEAALVTRCVTRFKLTARETAVLSQALLGLDREASALALGIHDGTIKAHIASILRRTAQPSLRALVAWLRSGALDEAKPAARRRRRSAD
jgi:DNA-binding NarL/FixJ family response regulator